MQNDPLNLTLGSALQIQATVPEGAPRYSVRLIGALPGASLIVSTPMLNGKLQLVREGQRFTVRALKGERVMGFVAQVLYTTLKPYPHLHLEYPDNFEQIVVRNASRVTADIAAEVFDVQRPGESTGLGSATIIDLSETGAKIASHTMLAAQGAVLNIRFELKVSGGVEALSLLGIVKNTGERSEKTPQGERAVHHFGVQFRDLSRFQQVLLYAWVTDRVLQSALRTQGD